MKPRRWFRFSLRTFLVLVTLFGLWLGVQVKWIRDRHAALEWIREPSYRNGKPIAGSRKGFTSKPCPAPFSLRLLGEQGYREIILDVTRPDKDYTPAQLRKLFPEATTVVFTL